MIVFKHLLRSSKIRWNCDVGKEWYLSSTGSVPSSGLIVAISSHRNASSERRHRLQPVPGEKHSVSSFTRVSRKMWSRSSPMCIRCLLPNSSRSPWPVPAQASGSGCCLLSARRRDATWQTAVLVGAHVRTRHFIFIADSSSTVVVLVLPVPGGPQMRLTLLLAPPPSALARCTADMQLSMAPVWDSLSPNADSLLPDTDSGTSVPPVREVLCLKMEIQSSDEKISKSYS